MVRLRALVVLLERNLKVGFKRLKRLGNGISYIARQLGKTLFHGRNEVCRRRFITRRASRSANFGAILLDIDVNFNVFGRVFSILCFSLPPRRFFTRQRSLFLYLASCNPKLASKLLLKTTARKSTEVFAVMASTH